jgi:4-amino-4-deoxy-L-arabinose transferase-like glycosyltransferase
MNSYGKLASEIISSPRVTIQQTENRWQLMGLVFIALGAVALRSMWLLRRGEPWAMTPDSVGYLALAHGLLHGCGFAVWTRGICGVPEMVRTPGYPVFIAFFGCDWRAVIFVQAVLGGLLVLGLGLFAWRHFGFRAALLATLSLATDVPSILVTKEILTEASFQFVLGAGFLLLASAALSGAENRATLIKAAAGGLFVGAAALVRPVGEILVPFLWLPFALDISATIRRRIFLGATTVILSMAVLFCWAARNHAKADTWTLSTDGAFAAYYCATPPLLRNGRQDPIEPVRHELVSRLQPKLGASATEFPGSIGEPDYDSLWVTLEERPSLGGSMYRIFFNAAMRHPVREAVICVEGLLRLAFQPYCPGIGLRGLMRGETQASTLPVPNAQRNAFRVIVFGTVAFQVFWLMLAWLGAVMALGKAWRCGPNRYSALVTALWLFTMLLLAAPAPYFEIWDQRYRTDAVPLLALLAAMGWFSAAA